MPTRKRKVYNADTIRAAFHRYAVGEEAEDGEQRAFCPICEDPGSSNSPSASINAEKGVWNCLKNNHGGSISELISQLKQEQGFDVRSEAMKGRHQDPSFRRAAAERLSTSGGRTPLPDDEKIDQWTQALLGNKMALKAFMDARGIERKTIQEWEIGYDGQRYTIPIRDIEGNLLNVRRYKLNAGKSNDKMLNIPGHGSAAIYRPDILEENRDIVITEGETDCILLNQEGIPAITHTAGAKTFQSKWAQLFKGKNVWICYDADEAGRYGAKKVEQILLAFADNVFRMEVPETTSGADVTDYLYKEGHTARDFQELMSAAMDRAGMARPDRPIATKGEDLSLKDSMVQSNQSKTMELTVSVAGKQQEPYTAPRLISAVCDQSKGAACSLCPVAARNGDMQVEVRADDEQLFRFVDVGEQRRKSLLREIVGARCTDRVEFEVEENYHVEELLVQPSVDDRKDDETQEPIRRTAFTVGTASAGVNKKVRLVGKNTIDPKTGKLRFMAWHNEPVEMDIDRFELTPEMRERLKVFQPSDDQSPLDKCFEIAQDMSNNVTHIYGRDILHVGYDLVYHSVISFRVFDMLVEKGWLEMCVVGDTRTGKSEIAVRLIGHYRSGEIQSCEGMSFPGIVGGVQQIDGRWHMTWGIVPMNDRRMVFLDEMSGLKDADVIEQMSSIRSSGRAQITKIAREETSARTRLAWITNPGDGSTLKDHPNGGMSALRTVVPNAEDVARFDFVMATAKDDVDPKRINSSFSENHQPTYSSEDCEALVKWAWSLTRNDIEISPMAAKAAVNAALDLGERYVSDPPLVQAENVRFKILRIAAALAARTFSVNAKGKLVVKNEHVKDAVRFLDMVYGEDAMGYARHSRRTIASAQRAQEKRHLAKEYLLEHSDSVLLTLRMVGGSTFRTRDFQEHGGMDSKEASIAVKTLLTWQLITKKSRGDLGIGTVLRSVIAELEDDE